MARRDEFGIARQVAGKAGSATTTMNYWVPVEEADEGVEREEIIVEETLGTRFASPLDYGTRFFRITARLAFRMSALPRILSSFIGQPTTSGAGPFTHLHEWHGAGKVPEWMSMFLVRNDPSTAIIDLFYNARGEEFEIVFEPNQAPRLSATFIALDLDDTQANPTSTMDTSERQKFYNTTAQIDSGGGNSTIVLSRFAIRGRNNHDTDQAVLGSRALYDLPFGNADLEVEFTPREALSTHYRRNLQTDPTAVKLTLTADNGLGGAANRKVTTTVWSCDYIDAPAPIRAGEVLKSVPISARAKEDATGKVLDISVVNGVATY